MAEVCFFERQRFTDAKFPGETFTVGRVYSSGGMIELFDSLGDYHLADRCTVI